MSLFNVKKLQQVFTCMGDLFLYFLTVFYTLLLL